MLFSVLSQKTVGMSQLKNGDTHKLILISWLQWKIITPSYLIFNSFRKNELNAVYQCRNKNARGNCIIDDDYAIPSC